MGISVEYATLNKLVKKDSVDFSSFDLIFIKMETYRIIANTFTLEILRALDRSLDKVVRVYSDAEFAIETNYDVVKTTDKRHILNVMRPFNMERFKVKNEADAKEFVRLYKKLLTETPCIMPFLVEQAEESLEKAFGGIIGKGVCQTSFAYFISKRGESIPFEQKKDIPMACTGLDQRAKYGKLKAKYRLKDFEIIGATFKEARRGEKKRLTEAEVQQETNGHKFILSVSPKKSCLQWDRRRFVYSAWHGCIVLTTAPEQEDYPDCYKLDSSVFSLPIEEQKKIAKEQQDYMLRNMLSEEDSFLHFVEMLRSFTGKDFEAYEKNYHLQGIFD